MRLDRNGTWLLVLQRPDEAVTSACRRRPDIEMVGEAVVYEYENVVVHPAG